MPGVEKRDHDISGSSSDSGGDGPLVEVAVQLSRFHLETLEGSATGDVDIRGLCLAVGDRELLRDAHLWLKRGTRYGLVGRNGSGKSTLLRSCADKTIPGFPRDMQVDTTRPPQVLYVQQENVPGDGRSALQTVLDEGSRRGALEAAVARLEGAMDAAAAEDYLSARCPGQAVLLVSHDRSFLQAVAQETIVLRDGGLQYFPGTYEAYVQARAEAAVHKERQVAGQERQKAHLVDTVARAERAAREAGDDKRLLQAASRRKKIDRLGSEKTEDGKRFKRSYWAGYHETQRPQVELDKPEEAVVLQLPPPEQLRQRGPLLQLRDVTVAYPGSTAAHAGRGGGCCGGGAAGSAVASAAPTAPGAAAAGAAKGAAAGRGAKGAAAAAAKTGRGSAVAAAKGGAGRAKMSAAAMATAEAGGGGAVLRGVTLDIEQGARIGLLGLNGSGKSSLMRVLSGALPPAAGEVCSPCPRLVVGCLDQHSGRLLLQEHGGRGQGAGGEQQEQQEGKAVGAGAGPGAGVGAGAGGGGGPPTPFSAVQAAAPHLKSQEVYDYLAKLAVQGPMANTPLAALSGGQRCLVALALVMLQRPHVLLLDEPTNHLDLLTVQALATAVREWEGAAVIASHDLRFLSDTCDQVWVVEGGEVRRQPQPDPVGAVAAYASRLMERVRRRRGGAGGAVAT
ncbi:putative ABC transporter ATP-binding protein C29A3.09c [Tetrabaena socialis]|uniref:Putative ABC transporter ATP-binding protein C29A3.09c n=1 Tax=Tetrabaena socialis TaxID=47790 RepID=A0A2J8A2B6_9CHLO|nr:putative ABC transporter ATP-binding protein C29A3.09c [Tetrabaena socialis]|eukprot:PNH06652.1 putative ABC transporter ATP-binding protein C29A3.09c [Tetrabaena socialis]